MNIPSDAKFIQQGKASWYGGKFHGQRTASGEIFNKWAMTAAHRTLPLGTKIIVQHMGNGRTVKVKINDRGPFIEGRIIDLSRGAAAELNMVRQGVAPVRLYRPGTQVAKIKNKRESSLFRVQVGSFKKRSNALQLKNKLQIKFSTVVITSDYRNYYRVRVGAYDSKNDAEIASEQLETLGYSTWIVRDS